MAEVVLMWALNRNKLRASRRGFTIVELLIVIVVIAILAAISIVAYTGIQERARAAAATAAVRQVSSKIQAYAVENESYPVTLGDISVSDSGGTSYQYRVNNDADPKTWCVSATVSNKSFYASNAQGNPAEGACPGHGSGGVAAITNLVQNPSFTTTTAGWAYSSGTEGGLTISRPTGGMGGQNFFRMSITTVPTGGTVYITRGQGGVPPAGRDTLVEAGEMYTISGWVRTSSATSVGIVATPYDDAGVSTGGTNRALAVPANAWTRLSVTYVMPANSVNTVVRFQLLSWSAATAGFTFDLDQVMVTQGTTLHPYADGNSENWVWNGSPNASTSTGPPLP